MKRTRLNPISKRRQRLNAERKVVLEEHFGPRDTWQCWVHFVPAYTAIMGGCYGEVNAHEIVKRSQGGSLVDTENILLLCNLHNSWVENYPDTAHKLGLMKHAWEV